MHWLYVYYGLNVAESAQFGSGDSSIKMWGETIATFTWNDELQMPVFEFYKVKHLPDVEYLTTRQEIYIDGMKNNPEWANLY